MNNFKFILLTLLAPAIFYSGALAMQDQGSALIKRGLVNKIETNKKKRFLSVNKQDADGNTKLHRILINGYNYDEVAAVLIKIETLITKGADLFLLNNKNKSCIDIVIDDLVKSRNNPLLMQRHKDHINYLSDMLKLDIPEAIIHTLNTIDNETTDDDIDELCSSLRNFFSH